MFNLKISDAAEFDLENIFEYTFENFGEEKWIEYEYKIQINIEKIINNPQIGHKRNDIPKNYLAWPVEKHFIIYQEVENTVHLVRILHEKLNFLNQFV